MAPWRVARTPPAGRRSGAPRGGHRAGTTRAPRKASSTPGCESAARSFAARCPWCRCASRSPVLLRMEDARYRRTADGAVRARAKRRTASSTAAHGGVGQSPPGTGRSSDAGRDAKSSDAHTGPASISATACRTVTPHSPDAFLHGPVQRRGPPVPARPRMDDQAGVRRPDLLRHRRLQHRRDDQFGPEAPHRRREPLVVARRQLHGDRVAVVAQLGEDPLGEAVERTGQKQNPRHAVIVDAGLQPSREARPHRPFACPAWGMGDSACALRRACPDGGGMCRSRGRSGPSPPPRGGQGCSRRAAPLSPLSVRAGRTGRTGASDRTDRRLVQASASEYSGFSLGTGTAARARRRLYACWKTVTTSARRVTPTVTAIATFMCGRSSLW